MMQTRSILLAFLLLFMAGFLFSACNDDKPDDLIDEDTYIDLIVEFELVQNKHKTHSDTTATLALMDEIFIEYRVDWEQFERSHQWYEQDLENQIRRYRRALDRLNEITGSLNPPQE